MLTDFPALWEKLLNGLNHVVVGQRRTLEDVLICLFAHGHCLLEGAPGVGKTLLAKTLAALFVGKFSRIQFTPDLMPADITGTEILQTTANGQRELVFRRGALFAQMVLADEINRATPKTQSALLEAMQEYTVTVGGVTYQMPSPFMVIATQNPIEMEGTYPLPEAQLDRFFCKIIIPSPTPEELTKIIASTTGTPLPLPEKLLTPDELIVWQQKVRGVLLSEPALNLAARIIAATAPENNLAGDLVKRYCRYGASPRGGQALILAAKVRALAAGRVHIANEDIIHSILPTLRHRIFLNFAGEAENIDHDRLINEATEKAMSRASKD